MVEEQSAGYADQYMTGYVNKIRDLEEKQRIIKDRLLLMGKNLIDTREKNSEEFGEIKKDLELLKDDMKRMKSFLETFSGEVSKFAKKEDLEILTKQAKMFQPLEFVRKRELKNLMKKTREE